MSFSSELPHIDEHSIEIEASLARSWEALTRSLGRSSGGRAAEAVAVALGCEQRRADGRVPEPGSTVVGFRVARAQEPVELALEGRHRFSRYALIFRLDELGPGLTRLRAETRAEFPGVLGGAYRGLVIGTRGHVVVVRRMLAAIKRSAER